MRFLPRAVSVLLLGSVVLLSGCAKSGAASHDGRVHVSYWEKWTGFESDAMRAVVNAYNASQDRIFVDFLSVSQVDQKLLLATAGGNPPDVAGLWSYNTHVLADMNAIQPLDALAKQAGIGEDTFIPAFWGLCTYRNHIFALPTTPATMALHYNKRLFREAGLDPDRPPKTIEELDAMADRLTVRDANGKLERAGFLPSEPGWWNWAWGYWFGGQLYDGKDKLTITSPENLRAYRWVRSYAEKYTTQAIQTFQSGFGNFGSAQNAFLAEKVGMELQGVWMWNYIDKYNNKLEWGVAPFPYPADRPDLAGSTIIDMDTLVIPTGSQHPREAFEFMAYVASPTGAELLDLGQRKFSPLGVVTPGFYLNHPHRYLRDFVQLAHSQHIIAPPKLAIWKEFGDEMSNAFSKIWLMEQTPEQALSQVQARMQRKLDREMRQKRRKGLAP